MSMRDPVGEFRNMRPQEKEASHGLLKYCTSPQQEETSFLCVLETMEKDPDLQLRIGSGLSDGCKRHSSFTIRPCSKFWPLPHSAEVWPMANQRALI